MFISSFKLSPTYFNMNINSMVSKVTEGEISDGLKKSEEDYELLKRSDDDIILITHRQTVVEIQELAAKYPKILSGSNSRVYQIVYSFYMFKNLPIEFKIFGIGYAILPPAIQPESDMVMLLICFGPLGFLLIFGQCILITIRHIVYCFKNIKTNSRFSLYLIMSLVLFYAISLFAGYTLTYPNYSLYLAILFGLSKILIVEGENIEI